jgi:hypothetical protein
MASLLQGTHNCRGATCSRTASNEGVVVQFAHDWGRGEGNRVPAGSFTVAGDTQLQWRDLQQNNQRLSAPLTVVVRLVMAGGGGGQQVASCCRGHTPAVSRADQLTYESGECASRTSSNTGHFSTKCYAWQVRNMRTRPQS